jgi:hypothetical protein
VVVKDNERTFELAAKRPKKRSLLKQDGAPTGETDTDTRDRPGPAARVQPETLQADPLMEELARQLESFSPPAEGEGESLPAEGDRGQGALEEIISMLKARSMKVSEEEAEQLNQLGEELQQQAEGDPNQAGTRVRRGRREAPSSDKTSRDEE